METSEAAYQRGRRDGRAAAVRRISRLIAREEARSSRHYVNGIKAAELIAEHIDWSGRPLPDDDQQELSQEDRPWP